MLALRGVVSDDARVDLFAVERQGPAVWPPARCSDRDDRVLDEGDIEDLAAQHTFVSAVV
jgi:hypothetical protein